LRWTFVVLLVSSYFVGVAWQKLLHCNIYGVVIVEPVAVGQQRMKALFDFTAIQEGDLSFEQGTKLLVTVEWVQPRSC